MQSRDQERRAACRPPFRSAVSSEKRRMKLAACAARLCRLHFSHSDHRHRLRATGRRAYSWHSALCTVLSFFSARRHRLPRMVTPQPGETDGGFSCF